MESLLLNSLTGPVLVVDRQHRVAYANAAAGAFWRTRPEHLSGYALGALFGRDSELMAQVERAIAEEVSTTINAYRFRQGAGLSPLVLNVQVDPLLRPEEPVEQAVLSFRDQTHREMVDLNVQEQRRLEAIGLMLRRLAHELQNPLSGIKGATQLLARRARQHPDFREYTAVIQRELERMERLLNDLLLRGEPPALSRSWFNVHELLDTVLWFERNRSERVAFVREYDPSLPDLHGDKDRLHQVFLNLIRNAVEVSPPGEPVVVRTGIVGPWQKLEALPDPAGTFFSVEIMDRGPGVDEADVANLFTPFFTTKQHGSGLGLSISQQIVRAHQGLLRYRPRPGGGSVFSVLLPRNTTD